MVTNPRKQWRKLSTRKATAAGNTYYQCSL